MASCSPSNFPEGQTDRETHDPGLLASGWKKKQKQTTHIVNSLVIVVKWEAIRDSEVCGQCQEACIAKSQDTELG